MQALRTTYFARTLDASHSPVVPEPPHHTIQYHITIIVTFGQMIITYKKQRKNFKEVVNYLHCRVGDYRI